MTILWVTAFHFYVDTRGVPGSEASAGAAAAALARGDLLEGAAVAARSVIGLPGFRLDLLLLITGLVLCLGRPVPARTFLARRARSILPNYWLGSLAAAGLLVLLALVRAGVAATAFDAELRFGTLLAGRPYQFEWLDLLRSLSVVGRLETPRTMQVIAPSMWYLVLIAQFYLLFPWMRTLLQRAGPLPFLAICIAVMSAARTLVLAYAPLGAFDANAALLYALPCRLLSPALGMAGAGLVVRAAVQPRAGVLAALAVPAFLLGVVAAWLGTHANQPGSTLGFVGPVLPLVLALPALWVACAAVSRVRLVAPVLVWAGRKSLSLLVAQDFLRLTVGTLLALHVALRDLTWWLLPFYAVAALVLTRFWDRVPRWCRVSPGDQARPQPANS
jgi:peptidoglycan/LPS O-acetylase OafA/YrhL